MLKYYLDFEKPIKELDTQILELEMETTPSKTDSILLEKLKAKRLIKMEKIYSKLSRWQRVQLARHPKRPYSLDYIKYFSPEL